MNRYELVEKIAAKNGIKKNEADRIVLSVFEEIMTAVASGENVTVVGFGSFKPVLSAPRKGRNPMTGETIDIPALYRAKFIPGYRFKELVTGQE